MLTFAGRYWRNRYKTFLQAGIGESSQQQMSVLNDIEELLIVLRFTPELDSTDVLIEA